MRDRHTVVGAVALGGALGAIARWALFRFSDSIAGVTWWSTLVVNALGCLAMGVVVGLVIRQRRGTAALHAFLTTGLLGGFTTFSAFAVDTIRLGQQSLLQAAMYVLVTVAASIGLLVIGLRLTVRRTS